MASSGCRRRRPHGSTNTSCESLTSAERAKVLEVVNSPGYRNLPPKQVVPRLADEGRYVASESTIYRILRAEGQDAHRGRSKPRTVRQVEEHMATAANQVWSWDITYLLSSVRGRFFYLYLVEDVWSRRIVGFEVHEEESMNASAALVRATCAAEGVDRTAWYCTQTTAAPCAARRCSTRSAISASWRPSAVRA